MKYTVTIKIDSGSITIEDILAESQDEAFVNACEYVIEQVENYAKLDEIIEH